MNFFKHKHLKPCDEAKKLSFQGIQQEKSDCNKK